VLNGKVQLTPGLTRGAFTPVSICSDVYWPHLEELVFPRIPVGDDGEELGKYVTVAKFVTFDPHFAHASAYADVALERIALSRRSS
jgi:hypothetical protein